MDSTVMVIANDDVWMPVGADARRSAQFVLAVALSSIFCSQVAVCVDDVDAVTFEVGDNDVSVVATGDRGGFLEHSRHCHGLQYGVVLYVDDENALGLSIGDEHLTGFVGGHAQWRPRWAPRLPDVLPGVSEHLDACPLVQHGDLSIA